MFPYVAKRGFADVVRLKILDGMVLDSLVGPGSSDSRRGRLRAGGSRSCDKGISGQSDAARGPLVQGASESWRGEQNHTPALESQEEPALPAPAFTPARLTSDFWLPEQ